MKNIKSKLFGFVAAVVVALSLPATGHSQILYNGYFNIDWQYNWPLGDSYADKSSGWGMNFEGGYYFPSNVGLGAFIAFHTNNKYIPRQTFPIGGTGAITTDQQHSVFQLPFGVTGRYRFTQGRVLEPYVAVKVGANYARVSSYFYVLEAYEKTWGFFVSPELGLNVCPFNQNRIGVHVAAYYSYATNKCTTLNFKMDQLSNFCLRLVLSF